MAHNLIIEEQTRRLKWRVKRLFCRPDPDVSAAISEGPGGRNVRSQVSRQFKFRRQLALGLGVVILTLSSQVFAAPFTRLQVLLPGESAAPGSLTGKSGSADAQTVGVPFSVLIRAVDDNWYLTPEISDAVSWGSTDESASLPAVAQLSGGQMTMSVTLNAAGSFTISGQDLSDPTIDEAFSSQVVAVVLAGFQFATINQKHHTAGDPFTIGITAIDPNGNTVGGYSGPVSLQQFTSYGLGRVNPETVTLMADPGPVRSRYIAPTRPISIVVTSTFMPSCLVTFRSTVRVTHSWFIPVI